MVNKGGLSLKLTSFLKLRLYNDSERCMYLGVIQRLCGVWVVVCKPILVFYFGPNQALGLGL